MQKAEKKGNMGALHTKEVKQAARDGLWPSGRTMNRTSAWLPGPFLTQAQLMVFKFPTGSLE